MMKIGVMCMAAMLLAATVNAQTLDEKDLARQFNNPLSNLSQITLGGNVGFYETLDDDAVGIFWLGGVHATSLTDDWDVIYGAETALISAPGMYIDDDRVTGLGNTFVGATFTPATEANWQWGLGLDLGIPTRSDDALGADAWSLIPSFKVATAREDWVLGAGISTSWGFAGSDRYDVETAVIDFFADYLLSDGWYVNSNAHFYTWWEAPGGTDWDLFLGAGIGKVYYMGEQPVSVSANVSLGDFLDISQLKSWTVSLQWSFLFANQ